MEFDKRIMIGGLTEPECRALLIQSITSELQTKAGYIAPVMPATPLMPYSLPRPLVLVRNRPVFHMSTGHWDACVDFLTELGMPRAGAVIMVKRKQNDGTWREFLTYSNTIQVHVNMLRKYVAIIDSRYNERDNHE